MPKRPMSFKPTSECEVQLAELMDRWGCDRTAALVKSVAISFHWVPRDDAFGGDPKIARQQLDAEFLASKPAVAAEAKVLPKDPKEVAEVIARQKRDSELMLSKPDIVTGTHTVVLPGDPRVIVEHADKPTPSVTKPAEVAKDLGPPPVPRPGRVERIAPQDTRSQQQKTDDFYRANMAKGKKK